MKVRLKHVSSLQSGLCDYMFQFHEGPIKTCNRRLMLTTLQKFQFHEGPIKTTYTLPFVDYNVMFQFHEGPIKTAKSRIKKRNYSRFQFHEGPIKTWFHIKRSP